jgi:hypothetical protein
LYLSAKEKQMNAESIVTLIGYLVWPCVLVFAILYFRRNLGDLMDRIQSLEGPGDVKVSFDKRKVEQIVEQGKKENAPASVVAERIIEEAVVDRKELRILRALFGENGRQLQQFLGSYYRDALINLLANGLIRKEGKDFFLTEKGMRATVTYLSNLMHEEQKP